ncbi:hypothetical protein JGU66_23395 [Myxococcaceae bacterium JPH2]|nr:hypothetical protein [Myxococcaceae bacterium JPH2]
MPSTDSPLRTNRDLYLLIATLPQSHPAPQRSLEEYLTALWELGTRLREREDVSLAEFAHLLMAGFTTPAPPFNPSWRTRVNAQQEDSSGYEQWEAVVLSQIVDLHEMREAGLLTNDLRYFGLDAPSGARWYNFDPVTYLECGAAGALGGWEPGDDTGRELVPGLVAVIDDQGKVTPTDPRLLQTPTLDLPALSWDACADFLRMGQCYE